MSDPVDTDALRNAAWEKYASLNGIHPYSIDYATFNEGWDAAAAEVDRLRAVIENAPHTDGCGHVDWDANGLLRLGHCTCWKADAL